MQSQVFELIRRSEQAPESREGRPARACLVEVIGVYPSRTKVKRRKAFLGWVSWPVAAKPNIRGYPEG